MAASCPHSSRGRFVGNDLPFTVAWPGQCDCGGSHRSSPRQQQWLHDLNTASRDLNAASQSSSAKLHGYLAALYETPSLHSVNIDVSQVGFFWSGVPTFGRVFDVWWACLHCSFDDNVLWAPLQDAILDPCAQAYSAPVPFPGFFVQRPSAVSIQRTGVPDGSWVEIMRIARVESKPDAADRCTRGQVWFWLASGSGIWWNVGKSYRMLAGGGPYDAARRLSCADVRSLGYESIQLSEFYPSMALELIDCRGAQLEQADETWERACPPEHIELRAGLPPESQRFAPGLKGVRGSSRPCVCNGATFHVDCMPAPLPPPLLPLSPSSPPQPPPPTSISYYSLSWQSTATRTAGAALTICIALFAMTALVYRWWRGQQTAKLQVSVGTGPNCSSSSKAGASSGAERRWGMEMTPLDAVQQRSKRVVGSPRAFGQLDWDYGSDDDDHSCHTSRHNRTTTLEPSKSPQTPTAVGDATANEPPPPFLAHRTMLLVSVSFAMLCFLGIILVWPFFVLPSFESLDSSNAAASRVRYSPPWAMPAPPPLHPVVGYVGGCRSPWPRADFSARTGCNPDVACSICGADSSCSKVTMPSGMEFPRHNVEQYSGNAVWDGPTLSLGSAVGAMLGDPFEFAISPEMDALRRLFLGRSPSQLLDELRHKWHDEPRYPAYEASRGSRGAFLAAMSRLTAEYVMGHASWPFLAPEDVRQRLEAILSGQMAQVELPVATCAAVIVMDGLFENRSVFDIWVTSLLAAGAMSRNSEADPNTLLRQLYVMDAGGEPVEVDPSGEIYTTPYQTNANGFYAGNLTFVFRPTDAGGSGVDTLYATSQLCPGPAPHGQGDNAWHGEWCHARTTEGALEFARSNGDAGEMRTPNYKAPREIDGLMLFPWGESPSMWGPANSFDFDLSTLVRPVQWAFYRAIGAEAVLVLAPGVVPGRVYGIRRMMQPSSDVSRFLATKSPPESMGGPRSDEPIAPGVPFATLDRSQIAEPECLIPVWGILYRCRQSNLQTGQRAAVPSSGLQDARERTRRCAAASTLRQHTEASTPVDDNGVLANTVDEAELPFDVVLELAGRHVWPSSSTVDLAAALEVHVDGSSDTADAICSLSAAEMRSMQHTSRECAS